MPEVVGADEGMAMTGKTFMVTIDVEYLIENQDVVEAAASDSVGGPAMGLRDSIAQLLEARIVEQGLDLDGARVVGHSLTLPG
jgi:hypothetical protein